MNIISIVIIDTGPEAVFARRNAGFHLAKRFIAQSLLAPARFRSAVIGQRWNVAAVARLRVFDLGAGKTRPAFWRTRLLKARVLANAATRTGPRSGERGYNDDTILFRGRCIMPSGRASSAFTAEMVLQPGA